MFQNLGLIKGESWKPVKPDFWFICSLILAAALLVPIVVLIPGLGFGGPMWSHVAETTLRVYIGNTLILVCTVSILSILMAIPPAWLVSTFEFPGRRFFEWALVLPLAIPTYVAAFVYFQIPEILIPVLIWIRESWGIAAFQTAESFLRYGTLSILLAAVLFPYLYITCRMSFSRQHVSMIEAAQVLGRKPWEVFFTIALPLSRPAMVAGISLIVMEVINDYGAVHFFGVPTLTEGVFRTWFGLNDSGSAMRLASLMALMVFVLLFFERVQRGGAKFSIQGVHERGPRRRLVSGKRAWAYSFVCLTPLFLGLLFPVFQLMVWSFQTLQSTSSLQNIGDLTRSLTLSLFTAGLVSLGGLVFAYSLRIHRMKWFRALLRLSSLGYAIPGVAVGVGVMLVFGFLDRGIVGLRPSSSSASFLLSGSVVAIGFAYIVRFFAVSFQSVNEGMTRICSSLDEASRTLGRNSWYTLGSVNLPLLSGTLIAATMLVFVDVLKELPLTMLLRPADFETLAVSAFGLAKEGRIYECALPSMIIVLAGGIGLSVFNRLVKGVAE